MYRKTVLIIFLLLILVGCAGYSEEELGIIATQAALGTPPPEALQTAAAIHLNMTLTPTPTITPYPGTATMGPQEWVATRLAEERILSMTQQANDLAFEREKIRATEIAIGAHETQKAIEEQQKIVFSQQTAQAHETNAYATSFAAATSTQVAAMAIVANNTAIAAETQRVEPTHAIYTMTAQSYENRINEGQARGVELATERQELSNVADAVLPWALVVIALAVLSNAVTKWVKVRPFARDEHGREQTLYIQNGPITQIVKPELMSSPVMRLTEDGAVDMPVVSDPEFQTNVTRRAQLVEAIAALPEAHAPQAPKMLGSEYGNGEQAAPTIRLRGDNRPLTSILAEANTLMMDEE